ncbi:MAG: phosphoribosylanthranilate isomerase [Oceanospirillaceae bacterium]|jgi:phosphoribosylanthranilate isomerase|uniref:phosphoribosylanthranilate isomerase n=1 Tax=unclassified Thalassolituus TaxID=2624967 RepID=UPI000C113371|nr:MULTISPECIES: phosphoribosylanthranilate isomerase [unclassified Thalassolituus]MAE36116.1 phosphoribosylanthranilate isomerase [Oceanospirillaceae bacterium]MBN58860.1 phosphoribosylanthranilate isomerase [Oceanospirillaceae bacterium]MDQ4422712.1 phosphoribosylanthranilate isomerase [Thalassolituus sp.]MDQ4427400.1 phosphoribosylanthranilate isomerase [Thalassolituus sp.]|tara:strand:+ start:1125 stop:1772 length:648 start_codon:yes stop_codon:yes gene_type:complete
MRRTRIKICGITRAEDADAAVEAGADALGLVFYPPSPRAVDVAQAVDAVGNVPAFVSVTALFVNPTVEEVQRVLDSVRIDLIQFHGDEDDDFCRQFKRPYIKALRVRQASDVVASCMRFPGALAILLDSYKPGVPGGTGETFDWSLIPETPPKPIILAGGLEPDNVASAITQIRPFAVDISGGVEASKGIKDHRKIEEFVNEVYRVDQHYREASN